MPDVDTGPATGEVRPLPPVRDELQAILELDETAVGDLWRRIAAGESDEQIQEAHGANYLNFIWHYKRFYRALLDGDLPTAPTVATAVARRYRTILRTSGLSKPSQEYLAANLAVLERTAANDAALRAEDSEARTATADAEAEGTPGIYVYTLPHYLRHPFEAESDRTLFKVGHSNRSVIQRFRQQTRTTALPEEPILLRIYPTDADDSQAKEQRFHRLLAAADHERSTARTGGTEWFLTSIRFLDEVADVLGLEVRRVGDLDVADL